MVFEIPVPLLPSTHQPEQFSNSNESVGESDDDTPDDHEALKTLRGRQIHTSECCQSARKSKDLTREIKKNCFHLHYNCWSRGKSCTCSIKNKTRIVKQCIYKENIILIHTFEYENRTIY